MISLDTRWDPKAKRIYNPKVEAQEQSEPVAEKQPSPEAGVPAGGDAQEIVPEASAKEGGECPVPNVALLLLRWEFMLIFVFAFVDNLVIFYKAFVNVHLIARVGYVPSSRNLASFYGAELVGAFSECLNYPVGAFPVCS
ncbi:hypothetical protein PIB30_049157 [Stylosanthes scabra]|uniref:Uncharacterized protein n=1 Tax=Stylosanthes scabra TaxID=79078 RepID=A0ABU6QGK2_9FABA|nr:hypothetical protein [Stylosanthes scabra]